MFTMAREHALKQTHIPELCVGLANKTPLFATTSLLSPQRRVWGGGREGWLQVFTVADVVSTFPVVVLSVKETCHVHSGSEL